MAVHEIPERATMPVPGLVHTYTLGSEAFAYGSEALAQSTGALRATGVRWSARIGAWLRGDAAFAQLIRFALVGGLSNVGYILLFLALYGGGAQVANLAGSIVSTALANEMHRRLTFQAADRVRWYTAQIEGGALALAGLAITSAGLAILEVTAPGMGDIAEAVAVLGITAVVGTMRFLTLRLWVF
ncbi:GtrA family protein [Nocardia sp. NPDC059764]|uniref:GtrA family protein n=1 Tax=Nocardia sp. NPDC059764 TaxID=3346939 RepID=UPI0036560DA0